MKTFLRSALARRTLVFGLSLATTAAAIATFIVILAADGFALQDWLLTALFLPLTATLALSFWTAIAGFGVLLARRRQAPTTPAAALAPAGARTALAMPIYNEDPTRVFAAIAAMLADLRAAGHDQAFDVFVLSDTNRPEAWLNEEAAWVEALKHNDSDAHIFYRRRHRNRGRKSGNIAEFLERWGSTYDYMVVLDADSVMSAATLIELVRRMEAGPRTALIQVPPVAIHGETLLQRLQAFAGAIYGPLMTAGLGFWALGESNYWGHNAIIRVRAFLNHCGLPQLEGAAPLGGEILSHDFVEAALLRRAGWEVRLADDLSGSYEETPPTLIDHATRDRRWCQGNLQHSRLLLARGLHWLSRLHFALGIMSYLGSALWAGFLVIGGIELINRWLAEPVYFSGQVPYPVWPVSVESEAIALFVAVQVLLFGPKLLGLGLALTSKRLRRSVGGVVGATLSVLLETVVATLLAPVMMLLHSRFVVSILAGKAVGWNPQRRAAAGPSLVAAAINHALPTALGLGLLGAFWLFAPETLWWALPVLAGLILAIPLSLALDSARLGGWLRRRGLFLTPEESRPVPVLRRLQRLLGRWAPAPHPSLEAVIADPGWNALHTKLVRAYRGAEAEDDPRGIAAATKAAETGLDALSEPERMALLESPDALEALHRQLHLAGATRAA